MSKIKYNPDFLAKLAGVSGEGKRTRIVAAMNADRNRRANGSNAKTGQVSLKTLDRWVKERKTPPFLDALLSLCNNMDDVSLGDFFVDDDDNPADISIRKKSNRKTDTEEQKAPTDPATMLRMELKYMNDIETIRCQAQSREDGIRESYEKRIANATETILEQEAHIREMHKQAVEQQRIVAGLQDTIAQMQSTIASQYDQILQQKRALAICHDNASDVGIATDSLAVTSDSCGERKKP